VVKELGGRGETKKIFCGGKETVSASFRAQGRKRGKKDRDAPAVSPRKTRRKKRTTIGRGIEIRGEGEKKAIPRAMLKNGKGKKRFGEKDLFGRGGRKIYHLIH